MTNIITITTIVGAVMLITGIIFLVVGINQYRRTRKVIDSESKTGVFILVGFALLAMGSLTFLFGTFRPGP